MVWGELRRPLLEEVYRHAVEHARLGPVLTQLDDALGTLCSATPKQLHRGGCLIGFMRFSRYDCLIGVTTSSRFADTCSTANLAHFKRSTHVRLHTLIVHETVHVLHAQILCLCRAGLAKALLQATVDGLIRVLLNGGPCRCQWLYFSLALLKHHVLKPVCLMQGHEQ